MNPMSIRRRWLAAAAVTLLGGLVAVSRASGAGQPPATLDDVVTELRALRADMERQSSGSIRAQMVLARLQLQEGRISGLGQQQLAIHTQLAEAERSRSGIEAAMRMFNEDPRTPGARSPAMPDIFTQQLRQQQQREQGLRAQADALAKAIAEEQARWAEFNTRLDNIERELER
jgi:hypothetical protein